ncbi:hypothetical protein [Pararobbsia alpina]|nr:hypothetical protein [Pararobbsia alpina]
MPRINQYGGSERNRCRVTYSMEVARQAAHIESTLHVEDMSARVRNVVSEFEAQFGADDVRPFLQLLCRALEARGSSEAERVVRRELGRFCRSKELGANVINMHRAAYIAKS